MSLLNDALRRAKLEALERETEGSGDYGLPTPGRPGRRRSVVWPLVLIAAIVLLAGIGATVGWLLARAGSSGGAAATSSQSEPPATAGPTPATSTTADVPEGANSERAEIGDDRRPGADERASEPQPQAAEDAGMAATETTPIERAPVETTPRQTDEGDSPRAVESPAGTAPLTDGATYVRSLDLDGRQLALQGIAYQGGSSVAIINGLMVGPEDMIEGFQVVSIEPERVQLQGRGVTVYLALH